MGSSSDEWGLRPCSRAFLRQEGKIKDPTGTWESRPGSREGVNPAWSTEAAQQLPSSAWIAQHGLKRQRLSLRHVLARIGFRQREDFEPSLGRLVSSRYGEGRFLEYCRRDGTLYRLTVSRAELESLAEAVRRCEQLYRERLLWLGSGSRRAFGVFHERSIALVLYDGGGIDVGGTGDADGGAHEGRFRALRRALVLLVQEQLAQMERFNVIRAGDTLEAWQERAVPVTPQSLLSASSWLRTLEAQAAPCGGTACAEALTHALGDPTVEAVCLVVAGPVEGMFRELMRKAVRTAGRPVHVACVDAAAPSPSHSFLREIADLTGGRFHTCVLTSFAESVSLARDTAVSASQPRSSQQCVGVQQDVWEVWKEKEEASQILGEIRLILREISAPSATSGPSTTAAASPQRPSRSACQKSWPCVPYNRCDAAAAATTTSAVTTYAAAAAEDGDSWSEDCASVRSDEAEQSSRAWLARYGLEARGLALHTALGRCAFRHADGVVDSAHGDCGRRRRVLVNARYCSCFVHTLWADGALVHVYVPERVYRDYAVRLTAALRLIQSRLEWLQRGSRALFGSIVEDRVYVLIDTSLSMEDKLDLLKEKLYLLIDEQLRYKSGFNLVRFGSRAGAWRRQIVDTTENHLDDARAWVESLEAGGSTDTLGALRLALGDPATEGVYLLSDGRPDQPPRTVLSHVRYDPPVPVHTVSFCCEDATAADFLHSLASDTGGRYHVYPPGGAPHTSPPAAANSDDDEPCAGEPAQDAPPRPYTSEDVRLLEEELARGARDLERAGALRAECVLLDCYHNGLRTRQENSRGSASPDCSQGRNRHPQGHPPHIRDTMCWGSAPPQPPPRRPSPQELALRKHQWRNFALEELATNRGLYPAHTRSSLLRALHGAAGGSQVKAAGSRPALPEPQWLLPESGRLLDTNLRKEAIALGELMEEKSKTPSVKKKTSKDWLARNSLVAKRLTIMDALQPTALPVSATYVPILGKNVHSKVFNEIMPLAFESHGGARVQLVNPLAVNLTAYEARLTKQIEIYEKHLDSMVFQALPEKQKERFAQGGHAPSFVARRGELLAALEAAGWPVTQAAISRVEREAEAAHAHLEKARELRRAATELAKGAPHRTRPRTCPRLAAATMAR